MTLPLVLAAAAACLATAIAAVGVRLVRGTTAVPAAFWAVAAGAALTLEMAARIRGALADPAAAAAVRLGVVALAACPTMSLLGAKRPQHGVWQFIVATLAVVLMLPAAAATWVRPGSLPDVHLIERCFVPLLVIVGWLNFVGTRRGVAASCVAAGQGLLVRGFLPGASTFASLTSPAADAIDAVACGLVAAGAGLAAALAWSARTPGTSAPPRGDAAAVPRLAAAVDPAFLAVRETFGAAWALRIAERFDVLAVARGWPCRLQFAGLVAAPPPGPSAAAGAPPAEPPHGWPRDARRALGALLRRFVTAEWLGRHGWHARAGADMPEED